MIALDKRMRRRLRRQHPRARTNCYYCSTPFNWDDPRSDAYPTWDHKIPQSRGGQGGANKVMACHRCNQEKGTMSVDEFREYLVVTVGCAGAVSRAIRWKKHVATAQPTPAVME